MSVESLPINDEYRQVLALAKLPKVVFIDKIINHPHMESAFEARRLALEKERGSCEMLQLFHGTSAKVIPKILNEGFDLNMCRTCAYGRGVYFAVNASYSRTYSSNDRSTLRYMFLCDVAVGKTRVGRSNESFTPCVDNFTDSNSTIYVVNYMDSILPRYVIAFL